MPQLPQDPAPEVGEAVDDGLFESLYGELRALAGKMLRREAPGHTLPPTALVHEAYLRMGGRDDASWKSRSHFFAAGALAMRRILVDHARWHQRGKRRGAAPHMPLQDSDLLSPERDGDVLLVDDALHDLERLNPRHSKILELRFFADLTEREIAEALEISERTVQRDWLLCRAWLRDYLRRRPDG